MLLGFRNNGDVPLNISFISGSLNDVNMFSTYVQNLTALVRLAATLPPLAMRGRTHPACSPTTALSGVPAALAPKPLIFAAFDFPRPMGRRSRRLRRSLCLTL